MVSREKGKARAKTANKKNRENKMESKKNKDTAKSQRVAVFQSDCAGHRAADGRPKWPPKKVKKKENKFTKKRTPVEAVGVLIIDGF